MGKADHAWTWCASSTTYVTSIHSWLGELHGLSASSNNQGKYNSGQSVPPYCFVRLTMPICFLEWLVAKIYALYGLKTINTEVPPGSVSGVSRIGFCRLQICQRSVVGPAGHVAFRIDFGFWAGHEMMEAIEKSERTLRLVIVVMYWSRRLGQMLMPMFRKAQDTSSREKTDDIHDKFEFFEL